MYLNSRLRRAAVAVICVKVVGLTLVFDYTSKMLSAVDMPKALWSRATEWILLALIALLLFRYGQRVIPTTRLHWAVAGVLAANIVSTLFAENRYLSVYGAPTKFEGLTFVLDMVILYMVTAIVVRTRSDLLALFLSFAAATLVACAYSVMQWSGLDPVAWSADVRVRPFATLGNPNVFGHLLSLAAGIGVGVALVSASTIPMWLRSTGGVLAAAAIACSGIVATRGSLLGLSGVLLAAVVAALRVYGRRIVSGRVLLGMGVGAAAVLAVVLASPLGTRALLTSQGAVTTADRVAVYRVALEAYRDKPVLGTGPDSFVIVWPRYLRAEDSELFGMIANDSAHDSLLQAAVTTGSAGLIALVIFAASTFVVVWRASRRDALVAVPLFIGLAAYWAEGLVSVGSVAVDWFPWLAAGLAAGLARRETDVSVDPRRGLPTALVAVVLAIGIGAAGTGVFALRANVAARMAQRATTLGDARGAVAAGEESVRIDAGRADNWNELGRARFLARDWTGSAAAFRELVSRAPYEPAYWANLGRALAARYVQSPDPATREAALAAARVPLRQNPAYPPTLLDAADIAAAVDAPDEATLLGTQALVLVPDRRAARTVARDAQTATDVSAARDLVTNALRTSDSIHLHDGAAALALRMGDRSAAAQHVARSLALDPGDPVALDIKSRLGP